MSRAVTTILTPDSSFLSAIGNREVGRIDMSMFAPINAPWKLCGRYDRGVPRSINLDSTGPASERQIVYLSSDLYVARIDAKLVVELEAEIRVEREQGRSCGVSLLQRILARIDLNALDYADSYDRLESATYLLVDRYVRPLNQSADATFIGVRNFGRPNSPRLLHVMPPPDARPVEPFRPDVLTIVPGWFERVLLWWKKLSG